MANGKAIGVAYRDQDISGSDIIASSGSLGFTSAATSSVTQATNKGTGVTLNYPAGTITTNNASLASATTVVFTLTNSYIAAGDVVNVSIQSGPATDGTYQVWCCATAAGSAKIAVRNLSGGSLSEALVLNFAVVRTNLSL